MDNLEDIIADCNELLDSCKRLDAELVEIKRCEDFLIEEYKRNKRYFRLEPGRTTVEDVIKTCFEFGWAARRTFDYNRKEIKE